MPTHAVRVELPMVEVLNTDLRVRVKANGREFGELTISRGGVEWFPRGKSKRRRVSWQKFSALMAARAQR